mmetsp:Transcript_44493/g.144450  ORF Transcript_44493/g.144450 Transcript_44493/m.144450 type:complete len:270 (-) Transcript_44493:608-1417(-)
MEGRQVLYLCYWRRFFNLWTGVWDSRCTRVVEATRTTHLTNGPTCNHSPDEWTNLLACTVSKVQGGLGRASLLRPATLSAAAAAELAASPAAAGYLRRLGGAAAAARAPRRTLLAAAVRLRRVRAVLLEHLGGDSPLHGAGGEGGGSVRPVGLHPRLHLAATLAASGSANLRPRGGDRHRHRAGLGASAAHLRGERAGGIPCPPLHGRLLRILCEPDRRCRAAAAGRGGRGGRRRRRRRGGERLLSARGRRAERRGGRRVSRLPSPCVG